MAGPTNFIKQGGESGMNRTPAWDELSTDSAQLLLCDLQPEIVARSKTIHRDVLSKSAGVLLEIAKVFSLPTTLSVVPEGDKAPELISELRGSGLLKRSCAPRQARFLMRRQGICSRSRGARF
jgi:hypothetical protein